MRACIFQYSDKTKSELSHALFGHENHIAFIVDLSVDLPTLRVGLFPLAKFQHFSFATAKFMVVIKFLSLINYS